MEELPAIIAVPGPTLRYDEVSAVQSLLLERAETAHGRLIARMGKLEYTDSRFIASLIHVRRECTRQGGNLILCEMQGTVKKIFEMMKLDTLFTIHETLQEAEDSFHG